MPGHDDLPRVDLPRVDHERVAPVYAVGRALGGEALAAWGAAVGPHLPRPGPQPVLDLGAGTGTFVAALAAWAGRAVAAAWLSAVVHHLDDLGAAAGELRRVLGPDAPVLVRGLFPDRSRLSWLAAFPGHERALARFPTVARVADAAAPHGLRALDAAPHAPAETVLHLVVLRTPG